MRKPNFFIVGQTRSGTTTLFAQLKQHPDVYIVHSGREHLPPFFGFESKIRTEEEYLETHYADAKDEKRVGEKNTDNLMAQTSASKIHHYYPDAKIIINLRNPVDMMISLHNLMSNSIVIEPILDFEEAINAEKIREEEERLHPGKYNPNLFYRKNARYIEQVKRYVDLFGMENIHIRIFDDFLKDPIGSYKKTCKFLDIDSNFTPTVPHENKRRVNRSRTLQSIIHKNRGNKAKKFLGKIPKIQSLYNSINRPYATEDNVSNELREKLKNDLKPEIDELSKLLGRDLSYWCQN